MIEYKVRPVGRYIVTRYEAADGFPVKPLDSRQMGEFPNHDLAKIVANALANGEDGATATSNTLPMNAPAAELLRNIADQFAGRVETGIVVLVDRDGEVSVFGLAPVGYPGASPNDVLCMAKAKLAELGAR